MKRAGFTMIELIFVIVILGILAAVAVPKLAATRDDAKIAKGASAIATAISDFGASYTSQGKFGFVRDITNVKFVTAKNGSADAKDVNVSKNSKIFFNDSNNLSCLSFQGTATDGNLTVFSESNSSTECKGINTAVLDSIKLHHFGGSGVKW